MKKVFAFCMMALLLASSLVLFSCDDGGGASSNPFIGNWVGTASIYGYSAPATATVTSSGWTFKCPEAFMNETGTITVNGNSATLHQNNVTFGTATVSGKTLSVMITSGPYQSGTGTFTKQ